MKTFLLPEDLRAELVAYLSTRPYVEVAGGIAKLQALKETLAGNNIQPLRPLNSKDLDELLHAQQYAGEGK